MQTIQETTFYFDGQETFYRGKVRDVYTFKDKLVMVATDRISAFDVVLPYPIPFKGQVLNQLSQFFLEETTSIVPNWFLASPDPNVSIGKRCQPLPVEMVIRGYLVGSAWRAYKAGQRVFNGTTLPENLKENDPLPTPILTPTTKAEQGSHDEDITTDEIIRKGLVSQIVFEQIEAYTFALFRKGSEIAQAKKLILADTKYEFGIWENQVFLIDEIHTPDSARYFDLENFFELQEKGLPQPQRSKEMVRQWLIQNGFKGEKGQIIPEMSSEWIERISQEYIGLYEQITGKDFIRTENPHRLEQIRQAIEQYIQHS